jgi:pro-kumamolisin-like protein/Big-like domain-containing protein
MRATLVYPPRFLSIAVFVLFALGWPAMSTGQNSDEQAASSLAVRPLITQPVDEAQLTILKGNTHPLARSEFDLGTAPASLPLERMLLVLKRSPEQESALDKLLDEQQDKASPNYHKWLTPEQFGQQFGLADSDVQTVTVWLESHGFQIAKVANGRAVLEFSGSASQVQEAFHTEIHLYLVNGEQHWANARDPQIPTALVPAVAGIVSLNNFPRKPMSRIFGKFSRDRTTGKIQAIDPLYTLPAGCVQNVNSNDPCFYGIGPYDFATIYNVLPLWNSGINGAGQSIAIVGESNINIQDVRDFRSLFNLPPNDPQIILNGPDPGLQGDEVEANLDVQWSGAVAPNATIDFVVSQSTETTFGIDLSAVYIVDNNVAPVMSESYGECELVIGTTGNQFFNTLWQQAAAQGITVFISAGDNGSAGCDDFNAPSPSPAQFGLQVSGFASTPYNVAVGGTDFDDFFNPATYWNLANNSTTQASAKGYIHETTWNSTCTNAIFAQVGFSTNPESVCNNSQVVPFFVTPLGGSGGKSNCTTSDGSTAASCSGGYAKPSWQTGTGVPNDAKRDLPDVSLFASPGFLGNFYIICESDITNGTCSLAPTYQFLGIGGTSASSPAFAGIMALVNQQTGSRQGNANYIFYKLAAKQSASSCNSSAGPASTCIFNDVTSGTIAMPCFSGSPNCTTTIAGDAYGILTGYNATAGYDLATGLGSVNVQNLVTKWNSVSTLPSVTTLSSLTPTTLTHGQAVNFSVTVKPQSGTGTPTGQVSLVGGTNNQGFAGFNLSNGTFSGSTDLLPGGTYSVTAHYPGDGTYAASDSSAINVTVNKENSQPEIFLVTFDQSGNLISSNSTTAVYGSPYLLRVNVKNAAGSVCAPVSAQTQTACPSGNVTLTDNGAQLDAGTYLLNSYGYFEDQLVQLPGGSNSVKASYAGDNSFAASATTTALSIAPATATITQISVPSQVQVGLTYTFSAAIQTQSSGAAPTGTVSFFANGTKLPGTVTYFGTAGSASGTASLTADLDVSFSTSGTRTITATYSGDTNYSGTTASPAVDVSALYPTTLGVSASAQTVAAGSSVTLTALVDTSVKNLSPTGTVTFFGSPTPINGTPTLKSVTDANGNSALQATLTITVNSSESVFAQYFGDTNYFGSSSNSVFIAVPDFSLNQNSTVTITSAGQSGSLVVNVNALSGFTGTVGNFTCSGLPAETTCAFNPTSVNGGGSTTVTISTTPLGQLRRRVTAENHAWWAAGGAALIGMCLIGLPVRRRRWSNLVALVILAVLVTTPGCGGGGGGGGITPNPTPSISSLSPSSMAAGSAAQSLTINGSGFISSSSVTFNGVARPGTLTSSGQLSIPLSTTDLAATGAFPVVVTNPSPGGGSSGSVNFNVVTGTPTGTFNVTVTASSGSLTHSTTFQLVVQ